MRRLAVGSAQSWWRRLPAKHRDSASLQHPKMGAMVHATNLTASLLLLSASNCAWLVISLQQNVFVFKNSKLIIQKIRSSYITPQSSRPPPRTGGERPVVDASFYSAESGCFSEMVRFCFGCVVGLCSCASFSLGSLSADRQGREAGIQWSLCHLGRLTFYIVQEDLGTPSAGTLALSMVCFHFVSFLWGFLCVFQTISFRRSPPFVQDSRHEIRASISKLYSLGLKKLFVFLL